MVYKEWFEYRNGIKRLRKFTAYATFLKKLFYNMLKQNEKVNQDEGVDSYKKVQ